MKKLIISSLGIALLLFLVVSCRKDNINGDSKNLILGSYITFGALVNGNLDISNASSTVSLKIKGTVGQPVVSINIYAATGDPLDSATWVLIKNVPYADGVVLNVTTAELATAFGSTPLSAGNQYVLQNEVVTKSGEKFSAANTPTNYTSFANYNMALSWSATAVCAFVQADIIGTYKVVSDANWQDFTAGEFISVTAGPLDSTFSFLGYPSPDAGGTNRTPFIVGVSSATDEATMVDQYVGDYPGAPGSHAAIPAGSGSKVFSCTGRISLYINISYGGTFYNKQLLVLQKQ